MIRVRFTSKSVVLDGVRYKSGDVVCLDNARANYCIDAGWAVDDITGRSGNPPTNVSLDVHDTRMSNTCIS